MKILKRLSFVILAVCILISSIAFTACTPPAEDLGDPSVDGYEISVSYPDGTPVKGSDTGSSRQQVCIVLLDENNNRLTEPNMGIIDEFGVAKILYTTPGEYTVSILNLPAGYVYTPIKTSATASKHRINLDHLITSYPVELTYTDGTAASDIPVKFMDGETEVASFTTGSDGKATSAEIIAGIYSVVMQLPESKGYLPVNTTMNGSKVSIEIFDISAIKHEEQDKLDEQGKNKWANKLNSPTLNLYPFVVEADYFEYTAHATKDHPAYYAIYARERGTYNFHVWSDTSKNYEVLFYGLNFESVHSDLSLGTGKNPNRPLDLDANNIYYFAITTTDNVCDLTFAVSLPVPSPTTTEWGYNFNEVGHSEEKTIPFEMSQAIIEFKPSFPGIYEIESHSDYDTLLLEYGNNNQPIMNDDGTSFKGSEFDDSGEGKNFKFTTTITQNYVGGTFQYRITIKDTGVEYPTTIRVSIKKIGEAPADKKYDVRNVTTTQSSNYDNQQGNFTWMPLDGSLQTYKNSNGIWYVKLANGTERPMVIAITKNIRHMSYSFATIEYMGDPGATPIDPDDPNSSGKPNEGDENKPNDKPVNTYLTVAENIDDYKNPDVKVVTMLNYRSFINTYKNLVNRDGVYELNDELKTFAEHYMNFRGSDITSFTTGDFDKLEVADGCAWLLCCGYYA